MGQGGERLGHLGIGNPLVVNDEPLEQRLVPLAAQVTRRGQVGALAVGE